MIIFLTLAKSVQEVHKLQKHLSGQLLYHMIGATSIASGYNMLASMVATDDDDILCFLHTDARLRFDYAAKIPAYFSRLDNPGVVGFVGCKTLTIDGRWWLDNDRCGSLVQGKPADINHPNLCLSPVADFTSVASVDGFCMFIRKKVFQAIGGFDERFPGWHHYDADLCTKAIQLGYSNYVINEVAQHFSPGQLDAAWHDSRTIFREKWKGTLAWIEVI